MEDVIAVHHHAAEHSELWDGVANQGHVGAEQFAVKGLRLNRAATKHRAFELRQVVWVQHAHLKLQCAVGFEFGDGMWAVIDEGLAQFGV